MKKIVVVVLGIMLLTACSSNTGANQDAEIKKENEALKAKVAELETANKKLKDQAVQTTAADTASKTDNAEKTDDKSAAPENINAGNTIEANKTLTVTDFSELTIKSSKFTSKVVPSKPARFYTYYEVKDAGNLYLDTIISIKSLLTSGKSADDFVSVKVKYDGKYEYNSFSSIEQADGSDLTYTNITQIEPLKTRKLHFIAELPKEASKDNKSIEITVSCNGNDYIYKLR